MIRSTLLEYFHYDAANGLLTWKKKPSTKIAIGAPVGYVSADGYYYGGFKGKTIKLHRAIFLMWHGYLPDYIDHVDGNRTNNRIVNLREATMTENNRNCRLQKNNSSGTVGVSWNDSRKKWVAMIWHNAKAVPLGRYPKLEDAITARKDAEKLYGYHKNHGSTKCLI